jgi:serine/threonine protein kinase
MQMPRDFDLAPDEWAALRRLLDEALDLPAAARPAWIDALGPAHAAFGPRLRALLAHAGEPRFEQLLQTLPKVDTSEFAGPAPSAAETDVDAERSVGPYRLLRQIGEGGMASVWLAERSDLLQGRRVALKLPHQAWRSSSSAERLAREREILATLNHPHIARLYDAGVAEDGQPYLALEFVEGQRIDVHCRERDLGLQDRLRLFLQVTRAVAHAHSRLVVHRDLKPNNILVDGDGQARLLDFGIAKLLEQGVAEETELTREMGRALTPDYAAPEQIRGEPIGTAADVYSLGVVLFELLAGERPYRLRRDSRAALEDAILHVDAPRPSVSVADPRLSRQLRGDLDTIVLKALKKEPSERYATVDALTADIERCLNGWPVLARPDSRWYRARKFVARNRLPVGAAGAVLLALLSGGAVATWQLVEASRQRDAAVLQQRRAESFSEFINVLLDDSGPAAKPLTMGELLDHGVTVLERQQDADPGLTAYMQYEISRKYLTVNQTERVLSLLDRAAAGARVSGDAGLLAAAQCAAAWSLANRDRALAQARLAEAQAAIARARDESVIATTECLRARARLLQAEGRVEEAIAVLKDGLRRLEQGPVQSQARSGGVRTQLSDLYRATDRFKEALALSSYELERVKRSGHGDSMSELVARSNHAGNLSRLGEIAEAAALQEKSLAWLQQRGRLDAQPVGFTTNHGYLLLRLGQPERALQMAETGATLARRAGHTVNLALSDLLAARSLLALGRLVPARERLDAAEAVWRADPRPFARMLQEAALTRAEMLLAEHRVDEARGAIVATLERAGYPGRSTAPGLDRLLRAGARIHLQAGDAASAQRHAEAALAFSRRLARDQKRSADVGEAALLLARARLAADPRAPEAAPLLSLASEALRSGLGPDHAATREAAALLAGLAPA